MSIGRMILAAVIGGAVVFGWGALSHMVLPLGEMGMKSLPDDPVLMGAMKGSLTEHGAYFFPGMEKNPTEAQQEAWAAAYEAGPRGMIVFDPTGDQAMSPKMMGTEFLSGTIAALIAAIVASSVCGTYFGRVVIIALMGVFGWVAIDVSYWNWYRLPDAMTLGSLLDQGVGWLLAGFPIAAIAKSKCGPGCGCVVT